MFHLQISQFRQIVQQHLILHYGEQIAPSGRLLPGVEEALSSLGSLHQFDVIVTAPITTSIQKEQPLKLSITLQDGSANADQAPASQISIWGVMASGREPDADRTLRPLFIEVLHPKTSSYNDQLSGILSLLQPGRSLARLTPQFADELPIAA